VLWRGELQVIRVAVAGAKPQVSVAADVFRVASLEGDLRAGLEAQFARRAKIELPGRAWELAAETGVELKSVSVRNQRSRWGSCSAGGAVSLNWRLVQTPERVRDYIIYHELMHLREMNHSDRFWARVEEVCPDWREAERWLKRNGSLLGL
jgi:predicted metal-dependent hydrolase